MNNFNLQKIIEDFNLDDTAVANALFPNNRYTLPALKRVIRDNIPLNLDQLNTLADIVNLSLPALLNYSKYTGVIANNEPIIIYGPYIVTIKQNGCFFKLKGQTEDVFIADSKISIADLIITLNKFLETWNQLKFK